MKQNLIERLRTAGQSHNPLVFAHRGFSDLEIENTLPAFAAAAYAQSDGVELDVQLSRDGEVVVFHDNELSRLAGDPRTVQDLTSLELRNIELRRENTASRNRSEAGAPGDRVSVSHRGVPLLTEVLHLLPPGIIVDVELKSYNDTDREQLSRQVAGILREARVQDRVLVSSFDPRLVKAIRRIDSSLATAVIFSGDPGVPRLLRRGLGIRYAGAPIAKPSKVHLLAGRRPGREIYLVWTVVAGDEVEQLTASGAAGLITNDPVGVRARLAAITGR